MLPTMKYSDGITKSVQSQFGGYNHNLYAGDGEIYDMKNLCSDEFPLLSTRPYRCLKQTIANPNGFLCGDDMYWVNGTTLYKNGAATALNNLADSEKVMVGINDYIVILPDKRYYKISDASSGSINASYTSASGAITFSDGTYAGVPAEANTVITTGSAFPFKEGDAVKIENCSVTDNNLTIVVREISEDKKTMRFYENSFSVTPTSYVQAANEETVEKIASKDFYVGTSKSLAQATGIFTVTQSTSIAMSASGASDVLGRYFIEMSASSGSQTGRKVYYVNSSTFADDRITMTCTVYRADGRYTESNAITFSRTMPEMDFICENDNRLFGCKGDKVYASKLGDPFNWNVFDGLSTDSYAVDVGSAGDFTGCVAYLGYPIFFKENDIYKLYGSRPANYQLMRSASLGVARGSAKSLAVAGEILFYKSRIGIVAYTGGTPEIISRPFGTEDYTNAVGGSDGLKYYVSMADSSGTSSLFVFDTQRNLWHREDETEALFFEYLDGLHFINADGELWRCGMPETLVSGWEPETAFGSMVEFGDIAGNVNKKGVTKLQLRMELESGSAVQVYIKYDSGAWVAVKSLSVTLKQSYTLPIIPHRADHYRLKITSTGAWRLYALAVEYYSGSEL